MHSGTVSGKSFNMFSLNQGLLARCVEAVKEGDILARKSGQIQSFEVFRNGFRMNLVIGRIMVIPSSVCDSKEDFPVALLYGALVREIRPEDLSDLMSAKIGDSEFDEYSEADMQEIKEKLFQVPGSKRYTSLVCFLPSWCSPREYVYFKFIKDDKALANALRHVVFSAYFDPRLSSAFDHIMQDTDTVNHGTELDVTNITPKLPYANVAEGATHAYPDLQSADDTLASQDRPTGPGSKKKKASGPKFKIVLAADAAQAIHEDQLAAGEVDVIDAITEAAEAAVLRERETPSDAAADVDAAKHAADQGLQRRPDYGKRAGQVPCPFCKHTEPTTDDLEDHIARAHKNASAKTAQIGHGMMPGCAGKAEGDASHMKCPGVVEGVHCDCPCHEKCEQEGIIASDKVAKKDEGPGEMKIKLKLDLSDAMGESLAAMVGEAASKAMADDAKEKNDKEKEKKEKKEEKGKKKGSVKTAGMPCECADPGCPKHRGSERCGDPAVGIAYRIDMEDRSGTAMCQECLEDAANSGVFNIEEMPADTKPMFASAEKTADTADNAANEKGGESAIEVKTDAEIKNTRGEEPCLAPDKNAAAKCKRHVPHNPDTMQTVCENCGVEMYYNPANDTWRAAKKAGGHKPGCDCGFCQNKGKLPGTKDEGKKDEKEASTDKTASRGQFPHHMTGTLPNDMNDGMVIAVMHQLEVPRHFNAAGITASDDRDAESNRTKAARRAQETKLSRLRRVADADMDADLFAEVTEPIGCPPQVKEKDGDGRPDGATPKLADSAVDWFFTDRDEQGQPKENVPTSLEIPESEPVTGVYTKDEEGKDPVNKAMQSVPPTDKIVAPGDLGESKATDIVEPLDLNEAAASWLGEEPEGVQEGESLHVNASMTMKCPHCKGQASKVAHGEPYKCGCGWKSNEPKVLTPKQASDRVIATLDDLLYAEPFDPENEERPDHNLMEGLVSGPVHGGRHETDDTSGPANKVADFDTAAVTSDDQVAPNKMTPAKLDDITLGGPQNSTERPNVDAVREQVETSQEMDKHETIEEKEAEVAAKAEKGAEALANNPEEEGATEVVNAPAGSGKIVININAMWLKAHGIEADGEVTEPKGIEVYDNGGKTIDRYTVVFTGFPDPAAFAEGVSEYAAVGMGEDISSPQGFYQHTVAVPGEHLGKRISFSELPETHQQRIADELANSGKEAGSAEGDYQSEPVTSGMSNGNFGGSGAVGSNGAPNLAVQSSDEIAITAGPLAEAQADFFSHAKEQLTPHLPPVPGIGGAAEGGALEELAPLALAAGKTADRALPRVTTPSKNYNGWHNWETWHVNLLIDNEEPLYNAKHNLARRAIKEAKGGPVNIDKLADQMSKVLAKAYKDTKAFYESNAREMPDSSWATEPFEEVNWHEIAENTVEDEQSNLEYEAKQTPTASADKEAATEKEAGFNFWFPGQVLREFYPEVQHEIVDYPNADNKPMIQDVDLQPEKTGGEKEATGEELGYCKTLGHREKHAKGENCKEWQAKPHTETEKEAGSPNYVSTDPGAIGIGRDGKPQVLEGAPLRKEWDIRGPMFSEEFYANYPGVPGKYMAMASDFKKKAAASEEQKTMLADFLKKVVGEIAVTFAAAFKVTSRPVDLDKIPGTGEVNLVNVENSVNNWPFYAGEVGGRIKWLLENMNDSDIQDSINDSWAQAAVWHDGSGSGNFTYEVFVRAESIDTDSMVMKYRFVTGTKGE